ncbi:hypothetical protein BGZ63DRAFT_373684 [Mariannaea sp. PMI_226]|nr:hypothetical protein BGZ63DRAFT_373684 [Mariannaea sp. PMI_226]
MHAKTLLTILASGLLALPVLAAQGDLESSTQQQEEPAVKKPSAYCPPYVCPHPFSCYQRINMGYLENYCQ